MVTLVIPTPTALALTHLERLAAHPGELCLVEEIGEIDPWVVYGTQMRFRGEAIGDSLPGLFRSPSPTVV
jgi:hypothetical protein